MRHPRVSAPWGSLGVSRGFFSQERERGQIGSRGVPPLPPPHRLAAPPPSPLEIQVMAELGLPALQRSPG